MTQPSKTYSRVVWEAHCGPLAARGDAWVETAEDAFEQIKRALRGWPLEPPPAGLPRIEVTVQTIEAR